MAIGRRTYGSRVSLVAGHLDSSDNIEYCGSHFSRVLSLQVLLVGIARDTFSVQSDGSMLRDKGVESLVKIIFGLRVEDGKNVLLSPSSEASGLFGHLVCV